MKKLIAIYLFGVVLSWFAGYGLLNKWKCQYKTKWTYGDVVEITAMSLLSWVNLAAISVVYVSETEFWDKPINP